MKGELQNTKKRKKNKLKHTRFVNYTKKEANSIGEIASFFLK